MSEDYSPRTRAEIAAEQRVLRMVARDVEVAPKLFFKLNTALATSKSFATFAMAGKPS